MNKKLHIFLFCLLLIVIICLCKDKISNLIEPFGNQIVIHPDNASFDPRETTFSVLTYDSDLGTGVTQASICSDDSSWKKGDKTCRNYSLEGENCEDIGDDGRLAFDACKVACDNCNTYTEIKRRLPSPIEDTDEPSYAQFESSDSDGGDFGSVGGVDIREILGKLEELDEKMNLISVSIVGDGDGPADGPTDEPVDEPADGPVDENIDGPASQNRIDFCSENTDTSVYPDIICSNGYSDKTGKRDISGRTVEECCDLVEGPESINCVGEWSEWSECSAPCDGGTRNRTYTITTPEEHGGTPCEHANNTEETGDCNAQRCANCGSYTCPDNYTKRENINETTCGKVSCDIDNRDTCCVMTPAPAPKPAPAPEPEPAPKEKDNKIRNIILIVLAVLAVFGIGFVIWWRKSKTGTGDSGMSLLENEHPSGGIPLHDD